MIEQRETLKNILPQKIWFQEIFQDKTTKAKQSKNKCHIYIYTHTYTTKNWQWDFSCAISKDKLLSHESKLTKFQMPQTW